MSENKTEINSGGSLLGTLLLVLFIGLKLTHYIDWSWWWVLSPIWLPFAIILCVLLVVLIVIGLIRAAKFIYV